MRTSMFFLVVLSGVTARTAALPAQQFDTVTSRAVAPGVIHRQIVINSGPWRINVLEVDLKQRGLSVRAMRAGDRFTGRETVSSMVHRFKGQGTVVGAINGDFFNISGAGENENNTVIEGVLLKGVKLTDSPYDTFDNIHSQFAVDSSNHPLIERFALAGKVVLPHRQSLLVDAVNSWPRGNALVLYTAAFGDRSPADSIARHPLSIPLARIGQHGDTLLFRITGRPVSGGKVSLAKGGALAAEGTRRADLRTMMRVGRTVRIIARLTPNGRGLRTVLGGWPRLVVHGASVADSADAQEGTFPRFSSVRHPRTAVGFSRDSTKLYLITVDGRQESRAGMSLGELARLILELGVYEGMNFDGGGSTTMVVNGGVVNSPSDKQGERAVGSALLIVIRR
jgi:Phosphodiester glycosidase